MKAFQNFVTLFLLLQCGYSASLSLLNNDREFKFPPASKLTLKTSMAKLALRIGIKTPAIHVDVKVETQTPKGLNHADAINVEFSERKPGFGYPV